VLDGEKRGLNIYKYVASLTERLGLRRSRSRVYTAPCPVNAHRTYFQDEDTLRTFKENIKKQLMTRAPARGATPVSAPTQSTSGSEMADITESGFMEGDINANGIVPNFLHRFL
jgi:hypothetical protein